LKLDRLIRNEVHSNGVGLLAAMAHAEGLPYPTADMQDLMDQRNEAIMRTLDGRAGPDERARAIRAANDQFLERIEAAARLGRSKARNSGNSLNSSGGDTNSGISQDVNFRVFVIVVVALGMVPVVLALILAILCVLHARRRNENKVESIDISLQNPAVGVVGQAQEQNRLPPVVVGQPVSPSGDRCGDLRKTGAAISGTPTSPCSGGWGQPGADILT